MEPGTGDTLAGAAGWSALLGGTPDLDGVEPARLAVWAGRMADLLSPALADHLLAGVQERIGPLLSRDRAAKGGLYSRFLWRRQLDAVRLLQAAGLRFVCMKGFALAHLLYACPQARILGDVDLLLDPADLRKAGAVLASQGYSALPIPSRFGFISDASFLPIVSADGQVAIDLHVAPDAWPAKRALDAEAVFRRAIPFQVEEVELLAPAAEHSIFLLVTNMAKDRFGPEGVRKLVDAARLLRLEPELDWGEVRRLADRGGYRRTLSAFLRLLEQLGAPLPASARPGPIGRLARREIGRAAREYLRAEVPTPGGWDKLRREFLLGPDPASVLRINLHRLRGLAHPGTGLPPGIPQRR